MRDYDVAIVGAGTGGYEAAIRCAQLGLRTVIIEKNKLGGTCLNIGCIPTKYFVNGAELAKHMRTARKQGIDAGEPVIDMKKLVRNKDKTVNQLVSGVAYLMEKNGVKVIRGEAKFLGEHELSVNGESVSFDNLIIAVGSSPNLPPVPGAQLEDIMGSTELLSIDHVPESLAIVGGGVIGCELACVFNQFGSKVTVIGRRDHLIPGIDRDVADTLAVSMRSQGIDIITGAAVTGIAKKDGVFTVTADTAAGQIEHEAAEVMISAGRRGNIEGLEPLGLELNRSYITVDGHMRTSKPHIYAIGDVTGKIQLAHVASAQGIAAAENIAGMDSTVDYSLVPSCIFTMPEIGAIGCTEERAVKEGLDFGVGKFPMAACGRARTIGETDGFTKLVFDKSTGRVLGAAVIGPHATEIIGELGYIVTTGGTLKDIKRTIHGHPTVTETIKEAAHVALGEPISI